ncbi:N-acetylmuramoyl-L-alanine amidase [Nitratireductor sp. CAU 1489]|uniref:N-acetylmuramoyl-L-alanine amidase n=1 Tax=Nitratireductor arenosus TaxID=2682096 RepID=A0A844QGH5_9HYPH|nr:N-acetylmuramoyl-L-alanine amidase [Nitratireductor arenosus]MVA97133.1 N-acetylmuramoyl-L-alanine amidase [Nitratireductor arenosus]
MSPFRADHGGARVRPSPNHGERRGVAGPDMIVLHYTGMESGQGAEDWLCDPQSGVSSHYIVHEDGEVVQMVPEGARAWHAGKSFWRGETDINSRSVGIEIVNPGHFLGYPAFPDAQIEAVAALCRDVAVRHAVAAERVLAHSDVAPGRKIDPGEKFPWASLHAAGIGHLVDPVPDLPGPVLVPGDRGAAVAQVRRNLALYGYSIEIDDLFDEWTGIVVAAFQRHFRPDRVDGRADPATVATLNRLLDSLQPDAA